MVSAGTVPVGDYNVSFNYTKPSYYIVNDNASVIEMKTFDGTTYIFLNHTDVEELGRLLESKDSTYSQWVEINDATEQIWLTGDGFLLGSNDYFISGHMPLYDLAEFLKSLKIEKVKGSRV
jgi:hypothetical protein